MIMIDSPDGMARLGARLAQAVRPGDAIALSGALGTGKTTLARAMLEALGLEGEAPSPTFAIVQPYTPPETSMNVWHVDLYRVESEREIAELGLDEARSDSLLIIEWPERMGSAAWPDMLRIGIADAGEDRRSLTVDLPPAWKDRWPFPI